MYVCVCVCVCTKWRPLFVCAISLAISCRLLIVHSLVHSQDVLCAMWWESSGFEYVSYHFACVILKLYIFDIGAFMIGLTNFRLFVMLATHTCLW
jgi:hypothetical protein